MDSQGNSLELLLAYFEEKLAELFSSGAKLNYTDNWYIDLKNLVLSAGGTEDCLKRIEGEFVDKMVFGKKQAFG